ncbi:hypothetical protein [Streptomyces sp. NBC_01565]|uniref:hypothetical protein n=1 Tax=unclassified Streptomyces TaxID=2593676 RepID=UPI0022590800|nr:hypothetical protein [Streptomyces sp. NBC_01565]MCX4546555.1 hypothetical protein [Streptomyces sp. NBC_01565]
MDEEILSATREWLRDAQEESDRPQTVMVGSAEDDRWVNWNLTKWAVPMPSSVPSY